MQKQKSRNKNVTLRLDEASIKILNDFAPLYADGDISSMARKLIRVGAMHYGQHFQLALDAAARSGKFDS